MVVSESINFYRMGRRKKRECYQVFARMSGGVGAGRGSRQECLLHRICQCSRPADLKAEAVLGGSHPGPSIPGAEGVPGGLQMIQSWGLGEPKR